MAQRVEKQNDKNNMTVFTPNESRKIVLLTNYISFPLTANENFRLVTNKHNVH